MGKAEGMSFPFGDTRRSLTMRKVWLAIATTVVSVGLGVAVVGCGSSATGKDKMSGDATTTGKMSGDTMCTGKMSGDAMSTGKMSGEATSTGKMSGDAMSGNKMADDKMATDKKTK
jgi:pentapeptide MXKDX repeat protein